MTPDAFVKNFLDPSLRWLQEVSGLPVTKEARIFLLAVALQESGPSLTARYQSYPAADPGPARGWWQFEQGGGVAGVLHHEIVGPMILTVCDHLSVLPEPAACWRSIEGNDRLATAFARLLLYSDPYPVPTDQDIAWDCYMRLWRPGKPHPETWPTNWQTAQATISGLAKGRSKRSSA